MLCYTDFYYFYVTSLIKSYFSYSNFFETYSKAYYELYFDSTNYKNSSSDNFSENKHILAINKLLTVHVGKDIYG